LYIVTEPVVSLQQELNRDKNEAGIVWGLYNMAVRIQLSSYLTCNGHIYLTRSYTV